MTRLERLHAIGEVLRRRAPQPVSAAFLADRFGVSRRTIERDIEALRSAGVAVGARRGRLGGHVGLEVLGKSVVALSAQEVTALLIAVAMMRDDTPFTDAAKTASDVLMDALPGPTRVGVEELRKRILVRRSEEAGLTAGVRHRLEEAVRQGLVVNLSYIDAQGERTKRSVEAVGFYDGTAHWYLVGWCRLRDAGRIFRLDRVESVRLTREIFQGHELDVALGWVPHELVSP